MNIILSIPILILLFKINIFKANNIIQIPKKEGHFKNISTKYGYINYHFYAEVIEVIKWPFVIDNIIIEGIKNLSLVNFSNYIYYPSIEIYGINKDNLKMVFGGPEIDIFSPIICKLFYETNYIDKMIYSIGKNENNEFYKFFGGTPQNLTKNLNVFNFSNKTKLSEIKIELNNATFLTLNINKNITFEISDIPDSSFCLPYEVFDTFRNLFIKNAEEYKKHKKGTFYKTTSLYSLNETQKNNFLINSITFKIGNKNIKLNQNNILKNESEYLLYRIKAML